jgi:hypothetical protein
VPSSDPLAAAVDRLYIAFSGVRRPSVIEYCTCCFSADEEHALLAPVALRQLSVDVLRPYAFDVLLTVGDVEDFRYFLPRILEVACTVGFNGPDLEPLAGRLARAQWLDWPAAEQVAVRDVLAVLWATTLAVFPSEPDADTVLCALGNAGDDLRPHLARWMAELRQPAASAHLLELLHHGARWTSAGWKLRNAFWGSNGGAVAAWLAGPDLRRAVAAAFTVTENESVLQVLADIHDLLGPPETPPVGAER